MKRLRIVLVPLLAVLVLIFCVPSRAAAPVTNRWDSSLAEGMTLTRGNSETFLSTLTFKAMRKATNSEVLVGATGSYGESTREVNDTTRGGNPIKRDETTTTAANAAAYGQFNYLFTDGFTAADVWTLFTMPLPI